MLKPILSLILCICSIFMCACGHQSSSSAASSDNQTDTTNIPSFSSIQETIPETVSNQVEVDDNILTVELIFPASFFSSLNSEPFDVEEYRVKNGFISAEMMEDGSLRVVMLKSKHMELLAETSASIEEVISQFLTDPETSYIKAITHNEDFSKFTMEVDRLGFQNSYCPAEFSIILISGFYYMLAGISPDVIFETIDTGTKEIISSNTY